MKSFDNLRAAADSSAALPGSLSPRPAEGRAGSRRLSWRPVALRELLKLEAPLLALLAMIMLVSLTSSPDFVIEATGWELPQLLACPFLLALGIPCPWCGMTRSFMAMGGLDLQGAFIFNPLGPVLFPLFAAAMVLMVVSLVSRRRLAISLPRSTWKRLVYSVGAVTAVTWILKLYIWQQVGLF